MLKSNSINSRLFESVFLFNIKKNEFLIRKCLASIKSWQQSPDFDLHFQSDSCDALAFHCICQFMQDHAVVVFVFNHQSKQKNSTHLSNSKYGSQEFQNQSRVMTSTSLTPND